MRRFNYKQVIAVRTDLKMSKGKTAVQVAHGSVSAYIVAKRHNPDWVTNWIREGQKKVTVKVRTETDVKDLATKAHQANLPYSVINDAGLTELTPGTTTVIAIGPALETTVDRITGHLKLL